MERGKAARQKTSAELLRALWRAYLADTAQREEDISTDRLRQERLPELRAVIERFTSSQLSVEEFHEALSPFTHEALRWPQWSLTRSLLRLVADKGDEDSIRLLRRSLFPSPQPGTGSERATGVATIARIGELATDRAGDATPFTVLGAMVVLSSAWEAIEPERFPAGKFETWRLLIDVELLDGIDEARPDYDGFLQAANEARRVLEISSWELEHAASWYWRHPFIGVVADDFRRARRNRTLQPSAGEAARNARALRTRLAALLKETYGALQRVLPEHQWEVSSERVSWSEQSSFRSDAWVFSTPKDRPLDPSSPQPPQLRAWLDETGVYAGLYVETGKPELARRLLRRHQTGVTKLQQQGYATYSPRPPLAAWRQDIDAVLLLARRWPQDEAVAEGAALKDQVLNELIRCHGLVKEWEADPLLSRRAAKSIPAMLETATVLPDTGGLDFEPDRLELYVKLIDGDAVSAGEILAAIRERGEVRGEVWYATDHQISEERLRQLRALLDEGYQPKLVMALQGVSRIEAFVPIHDLVSYARSHPVPSDPQLLPTVVGPDDRRRTWLRLGRVRYAHGLDQPPTAEEFVLDERPLERLSELIEERPSFAYIRYQPLPQELLDPPLRLPTPERFETGLERIARRLEISRSVVENMVANLVAGRNIILVGPTGSGKTELAQCIPEAFFEVKPHVVTATADWTSYEVIGGFFPQVQESPSGRVQRFVIRPGHVYQAVDRNWEHDEHGRIQRELGRPVRRSRPGGMIEGTWLVIDELNRADVDKAFGELFTALDHRKLRVPMIDPDRPGQATDLLPIPNDFRIIATMNSADRHYLFSLSDALKRRFAFVQVKLPDDVAAERHKVVERVVASLRERGLPAAFDQLHSLAGVLYELLGLIRVFYPVGVAQTIAVLDYAAVRAALTRTAPDEHLEDGLLANVVPQLENLPGRRLRHLQHWASAQPERMVMALAADADALMHDLAIAHDVRLVARYLGRRCHKGAGERSRAIDELLGQPPSDDNQTKLRALLTGEDEGADLPGGAGSWAESVADEQLELRRFPRVAEELGELANNAGA